MKTNPDLILKFKYMRIKSYVDLTQKIKLRELELEELKSRLLIIVKSLDTEDIELINYVKERI